MSSFDDLFRQEASDRSIANASEQPFDKEAWAQRKQELRQWTYDTIDAATTGIAQNGEQFRQYLDVQSRFDRYSVSNALLILVQRPEATRIADFDTWKEQGVYIRRKETGRLCMKPCRELRPPIAPFCAASKRIWCRAFPSWSYLTVIAPRRMNGLLFSRRI